MMGKGCVGFYEKFWDDGDDVRRDGFRDGVVIGVIRFFIFGLRFVGDWYVCG